MVAPENKNSIPQFVRVDPKRLTDHEKNAFFGPRAWQMSVRSLVYYGQEGESLASFHAATINNFIPILEGIPGELEVFGNGDKRFLIGFKANYVHIDDAIRMANNWLKEQAIQEIPPLPSIDDLFLIG